MRNRKIPYLCGGTFFFLLVQAKKPRAKAREREKGVSDGLKDPAMMNGLIQAITGNNNYIYEDSLKKNTSQFRECKIDGSAYIPFNDTATANAYDYEIINNYDVSLSRMQKFTDDFLNPAKGAWLVHVLLDVIEHDTDIENDALFYVQHNGKFLSKIDLQTTTHFELQPFLVGVVHYILMNRSDNISGQDTLDEWGVKKSKRSERKLKSSFSLGFFQSATVDWCTPSEHNIQIEKDKIDEEQECDAKYIETETVDNSTNKPGENDVKATNQSIFINNGNGVQIGINYGTINVPLHKMDNDR